MNDARMDALERMTKSASRKGDVAASLVISLALILRNGGLITDEQYEDLKRERQRLEADH